MRLYTPAKGSSSGGEESERDTPVARREKPFPNDPRPHHRTTDHDKPRDDKRSRGDDTNTTRTTTTTTQDSLPFKSPLQEEATDGRRREVNGEGHTTKQNGAATHELSPSQLQNGADTLSSLDSVPWNLDGIETIKENGSKSLLGGKWSMEENGDDTHCLHDEDQLHAVKEENKKLKTALKEAAEVNGQWRQYNEQRQQYVQRLLTTLHELQHPRAAAHSPRQQLEVDQGGPEGEARRLQEALTRLQADHDEHVTLLEMQVRAHRDDWEAERSEKQATQTALAEAQARTALLLQELQLLQAKLADSESKRGLCWRCAGPIGGESHSASPSTQASPIPAPTGPSPSPGPAASPTPLQEAQQAPLKGWIPVSMLHQIAYSGATPEHQTPVVQRPLTPSRGQPHPHHHHHHHHHHHQQRPTSLTPKQGEGGHQEGGGGGRVSESKVPSPRRTPSRDKTPATGEADERKKYEAMGARPKVLGNLQSVGGKEEDFAEDEKSAKHRARSILASALPVSPVSGSPTTPFSVTKSPSNPNMPKGYVPITSTILTPVNFRPPFVAHKRPSAIKQSSLQNQTSSTTTTTTTSSTTPTHTRSSPSSTTSTAMTTTTTTTTSANRSTPTPNRHTTTSSTAAESQGSVHNTTHTSETSKTSAEGKVTKTHSRGSKTQVRSGTQDRKKSTTTAASAAAAATTTLTTTTLSTHSTNTTAHTNTTSLTDITTASPSTLTSTSTTTTLSSSSPTPSAASSVSSSNRKSDSVSSRSANQSAGNVVAHQSLSNAGFQAVTAARTSSTTTTTTTTVSPSVSSASAHTKGHDNTSNTKGRNGASRASHKAAKPPSPLPDTSTTTEGQIHPGAATTGSHSSPTTTTAFAAITVTSTTSSVHVPPSPSTYSSTPSSRSSSPGISLTTFGLNSEGRGIPGAIFFALSPEQRGARSPQLGVSSRRASSSSSGTHSHTPDPVTGSHAPDGRPPPGIKSPPVAPNRPSTPCTVTEEQWWSDEGENQGSTSGRQQHSTPGKLVNSTWVKLMGSRGDGRQSSGLPWRTARAVSGQTLKQVRRSTAEDSKGDPSEPASPGSLSSTATFSYTPAVNSPPSSANSSAASSPLPSLSQRDDLKSMASKNITSAIMSYELSTKCENAGGGTPTSGSCPDGVDTLTRQDLICPSCQMLFPHDKHILFLDHFEACRGPAYADL